MFDIITTMVGYYYIKSNMSRKKGAGLHLIDIKYNLNFLFFVSPVLKAINSM